MNKILQAIGNFFAGDTIKEIIDLIPTQEKKNEFQLKLRASMQEFLKMEFDDLQNARELQIEALKQNDIFAKRFLYYLTGFLVFATVAVTLIPFWVEIPKDNASLVYTGTGILYTITGQRIMSFFFGMKNENSQN